MKIRTAAVGASGCMVLVALQAWMLRRNTPTLMPASGCTAGDSDGVGGRDAVSMLVLGDSSAMGVGVRTTAEALAAHIAAEITRNNGRHVHWAMQGKTGASVADVVNSVAGAGRFDYVVVAVGVNDVLHLRSSIVWKRNVQRLINLIHSETSAKLIVLLQMPPLWKFAALPFPLRLLLGLEGLLLDRATRAVAHGVVGVEHLRIDLTDQRKMLSVDRFHPSSLGYLTIARPVARLIVQSMKRAEGST